MKRAFFACALLSMMTLNACSPDSGSGGAGGTDGAGGGGGSTSGGPVKTATVIVPNDKAWGVLVDGDTIYWTSGNYPTGGVRKAKRDGTDVVTLWQDGNASCETIIADATTIYAIDALGGRVVAVPKAGGNATELVPQGPYAFLGVQGLAVDDGFVYFTGRDAMQSMNVVGKVPKTGGPITILAMNDVDGEGIAVDATQVYFPTRSGAVSGLASVPKAGGAAQMVAMQQCLDATIVGSKLYCTHAFDVVAHDLASPATETPVVSPANGTSFAIVGDDVFIPEASVDESMPLHVLHGSLTAGGAATAFSDAGTHPVRVAADATGVFVTDLNDGSIRAVAR